MFKADFDFEIAARVLVIYDLNLGNKSVTNDIENVLQRIWDEIDPLERIDAVIYRDSEGVFDQVILGEGRTFKRFAPLVETDVLKAIAKVRKSHETNAVA
jgi:hypothetical protein